MRAREADVAGSVEIDGVSIGYEYFGETGPAILLMPTWTIIHSRFWKAQVHHFARRHRVVTFDGPGNGRSDRTLDPSHYSADFYALAAGEVLDTCGVDRAVVVGLSRGAGYAATFAATQPDRVAGLVLVGPAMGLADPPPERAGIAENFAKPHDDNAQGWDRYNLSYWQSHHRSFAEFFFEQCFPESHSTKQIEDAVGWAMESSADVLVVESAHNPDRLNASEALEMVRCPVLAVHGSADLVISPEASIEAARITGGTVHIMEGSGHIPMARDPVRFNLLLEDFVERVA